MSIRQTAILCACLGLPPPTTAQALAPPQPLSAPLLAPWDSSPAPFSLSGALTRPPGGQALATITRPLLLDRDSGFDVATGQTLEIRGAICTPAGPGQNTCEDPGVPGSHSPALLLKLGDGHLALSGANSYRGNTALLQGSLGLQSSQALGAVTNTLDMAGGTRLDLADGVIIHQDLQARSFADVASLVPGAWGITPAASGDPAAILRVEQGTATWQGRINADNTPLVKDGAGTLRLLGSGFAPDHALDLRQGGLQIGQGGLGMGQFWFGAIHARPGTVLSGTGLILDALVAGHLRPGSPDAPGALWFGNSLRLADSAQTRLPVGLGEPALQSWGTIRLAGDLWLDPIPGQWAPNTRYDLVQADGGLDYTPIAASDPAAMTAVGISSGAGRFARVHSPVRYLDPVLGYGSQTVSLTLRYNARGLNSADSSWRSALLDDSRFLRESALTYTGSGQAWAQTWAANTERPGQAGLPGDDRDIGGLQLGVSSPVGPNWHMAAFAGWQDSRQHTRPTAATNDGTYHLRDRAAHLGLAAQYRNPSVTLALGAAQSHHRARISRQADPAESALSSRARAVLTQLWADARPTQPLPVGDWAITPWARIAWLHLRRPAAEENGGMAAVALGAQTDRRWLTQLGIRAERRWPAPHGDARMFAQAGVRSLWGGRVLHSPQAYRADPGVSSDATGLPYARHALQLDVGVQAPVSQRASVTLVYTGQHGGGQMQHGVWLGVSVALDGKSRSAY
ncbi:autotransporter outer membrane beta-barrel domain-containing protein [Castellaniella sp.]|uniref:autotransporter outer membrane beta-barrel domain-containing protein n=1 Tax=Castellaniella sp. TaxID=1955812 RepID=UPI002AFF93EA|nr:autotransporter outer membrane beta-barrel domain-containing protein [Castellaniella sp.]